MPKVSRTDQVKTRLNQRTKRKKRVTRMPDLMTTLTKMTLGENQVVGPLHLPRKLRKRMSQSQKSLMSLNPCKQTNKGSLI